MKLKEPVAVSTVLRTPFAQIMKGLGEYPAHHLGLKVAEEIIKKSGIDKNKIDGVIVGEGFPMAPNSARVISELLHLKDEIPAVTINQNCVSSIEAVAEAARRIAIGEGEVFLTLGEESQTMMPIYAKGARMNKKTANVDKLTRAIAEGLPEGVELRDSLEDGLGDGETSYGMPVTAELVAQDYGLKREMLDDFAYQSYKRAYDATVEGKYDKFLVKIDDLERDEAVLLRKGIVENPSRMQKAMQLFDNPYFKWDEFKKKYGKDLKNDIGPTTTIFNACARSDGASGTIVTTVAKAKELGLKVDALVTGWSMKGVTPNAMGIGQAEASLQLLEDLGLTFDDVDRIEIHEAFASTASGALEEMKKRTGFDWQKAFEDKKINPYGGSIAIGHPFGATGIRLIANAVMDLEDDSSVNRILITACAHGGSAGAMMIERA